MASHNPKRTFSEERTASVSFRVLVIEDNEDTRVNLRDILEMDDYQVELAGTVAEALRRSDWSSIGAILLDRKLPDGNAEELLPQLRRLAPEAAILIVTGHADLQGAITAIRQGAADYITKPINLDLIRSQLARISEQKQLARDKERSEAAFRTLVEAAPCMILMLRRDHSLAYFSRFATDLSGYQESEALGRDYLQTFLPEAYRQAASEEFDRLHAGSPPREFESPVVCKDGSQRWLVWNTRRLDDYDGQPAVLAVGQDITKVKQAQEQAVQSERLAAIGQMMTGLAHESGNALARSKACLEMLTWEVEDRPAALELIERIQNAQNHLKHLYEEVRGYAAPIKLEREIWNVSGIWRQAWENLAVSRRGRDAALHEIVSGLDLNCAVDQFRLEQVFRNILENALAACSDPVRIEIECADATLNRQPALRIAVRDNGPGLNPEQRLRIFDPFFTTKTKGTGLGMAIAKRIVDAHGGRIEVGPPSPSVSSAEVPDKTCRQGAEIVLLLPRDIR
jgi:PAS domain S-box-containing protein